MMRYFFVTIALVLFCCSLEAQIPRHIVKFAPEHVHMGDTVLVTYNYKDPTAAFRFNTGTYMMIYTFVDYPLDQNDYPHPILKQIPVMRHDSTWTGTFVMNIPNAKFFMIRFESGMEEDKNNGYFWTGLVYGKDNVPVENAYAFLAYNERGMAADSTYHMRPDMDAAFRDIDKEIQLYPKNFMAWDMKFRMIKDRDIGISTERFGTIDSVLKATSPEITELTITRIVHWYSVTGKRDKALALEDKWIKEHPHDNFTFLTEFFRAQSIHEPSTRNSAIVNLLKETAADTGYAFDAGRLWMINYYAQSGEFTSAESLMTLFRYPKPIDYHAIAKAYLAYVNPYDTTRNVPEIEHIMNMERAALDSESVHSSYMMDASLTMEDKRMRENATLAQFHYTIAKLAMRLDQQDTALRHIVEALRMVHAKDPEIISATLHMIIAMAKKMPMIGGMLPMVTTGAASNDTLWQLVEEAYKQFDHPPVSIDQMREMARNMRENSREAAFCRNIYRAVAPNIALPSLDQGFLDSLPKGKVIVLDFWGTWCTPCAITLPKLDSVYQQFKKNDDVRFYAIDCLEKTSSLDTLKPMVKDFLQRSGVTIPVLFDTAGAIVKSYDILFYPTRVVIDKKGIIRVWEVSYPEENIKDIVPFEIKELLDDACNKQP